MAAWTIPSDGLYSAAENAEWECELGVMAFDDTGKVTAMKAYRSADNITQL
jgi:hypothetical protein